MICERNVYRGGEGREPIIFADVISYVNDFSLLLLLLARRLSTAALDEVVERPNHPEVHGGTHAGDAQLRDNG